MDYCGFVFDLLLLQDVEGLPSCEEEIYNPFFITFLYRYHKPGNYSQMKSFFKLPTGKIFDSRNERRLIAARQ